MRPVAGKIAYVAFLESIQDAVVLPDWEQLPESVQGLWDVAINRTIQSDGVPSEKVRKPV